MDQSTAQVNLFHALASCVFQIFGPVVLQESSSFMQGCLAMKSPLLCPPNLNSAGVMCFLTKQTLLISRCLFINEHT